MARAKLLNRTPLHRGKLLGKTLPEGHCIRHIVMRELVSADEMEASNWAETFGPKRDYEKVEHAFMATQREKVRMAIVQVDGVRVNLDGIPYRDFDNWPLRTTRLVEALWNELNGLSKEDQENLAQRGEPVDPSELAPLPKDPDEADYIAGQSVG